MQKQPVTMAMPEEEDEYCLATIDDVQGFRVPPPSSAQGHNAKEWTQQVWAGRVDVMAKGAGCEVKLYNPNGKLFAVCPVRPGEREKVVQPTYNSSRYFALRIENASGKKATVGIVFTERARAFDFKMALHEHEESLKREQRAKELAAQDPGLGDMRLKEGQTIRVKVPRRKNKKKPAGGGSGAVPGSNLLGLAPPPGSGGGLLAPPPSFGAAAPARAAAAAPVQNAGLGDLFGMPAAAPTPAPAPASAAAADFGFGFGAPAAAPAPSNNNPPAATGGAGAGWVTF